MSKQAMFIGAVLLALAAAASPSAARPGDAPGRAGRPDVRPHPLKDRECVAECRRETMECLKEARAAAAPCFESCQPLVEAAREACADDPDSEACELARRAARACLDPCYEILRPAVRACIADGHECVRACPFIGEPPCLTECRVDHQRCLRRATAALQECRAGCSDEMQAAREACADDPDSEACRAATRAAHACLQPCREQFGEHLKACHAALRDCAEACGEDTEPTN
jgi:hypothetical protein